MSWFKVDDKLHSHPKWLDLSKSARSLWVTAGSWAADQCTDGLIPRHVLTRLDGRPTDAADLVRVGLWETHPDGWSFHDWSLYQPDAASEIVRRDAGRKAMSDSGKEGNHIRWHASRNITVPECPYCEPDSGTRVAPESGFIAPSRPDPNLILAESSLHGMAESGSDRRSVDARVSDGLVLA